VSAIDNPVVNMAQALRRAGISSMLTGSFAAALHGRPRATQDVDFVIEPDEPSLRAFVRSLPPEKFYVDEEAALEALAMESQFNVIDIASGWKIDLMIRRSRPFSLEEFARRERRRLGDVDVDVVSAEDLVIAKMEWSKRSASDRQLDDAASIVGLRGDRLEQEYIARWVAELGLQPQWNEVQARARP
jgi:hypothetical protein